MNNSKIQIKVGNVEFSGEGDPKWLSGELDKILKSIPTLTKVISVPIQPPAPSAGSISVSNSSDDGSSLNLSVANIASKLGSSTGPGLVIAAACYLRLVENKNTFSRESILKAMKSATGYYKTNYRANLTKILERLIKNDTLNETSNNVYSLTNVKEKELRVQLSN